MTDSRRSFNNIQFRLASNMSNLTVSMRSFTANPVRDLEKEKTVMDHNCDLMKYKIKTVLDLHPGDVEYSMLAKTMSPVVVQGIENHGVLGKVIIEKFWYEEFRNEQNEEAFESEIPTEGAMVWAYLASFIEGRETPLELNKAGHKIVVIDLDNALPGITVACRSMKPGQCAQFLSPASSMFGELGYDVKEDPNMKIPPSSTVLLLIHMIKWIDVYSIKRYDALPEYIKKEYDIIMPLIHKVDAVSANFYRRNRYDKAEEFYDKLCEMLDNCEPIEIDRQMELNRLAAKTHLNMGILYMKMKNYGSAMSHLNDASILCDHKANCKYLFWRGKCHFVLDQYEEAYTFFKEAVVLEPNNTEVGRMLCEVDKVLAKNRQTERDMAMKAFKSIHEIEENTMKTMEHAKHVQKVSEVRTTMLENNISELAMPVLRMLSSDLAMYKNIVRDIEDFEIVGKPSPLYHNILQYYFIVPSMI